MKPHRVAIYARLSRDDERQGESLSIENQKLMLRRYCAAQNWTVVEEYADDGWSGTNFQRPAFLQMMQAVRERRVDLVLVKDLSRLGRDYIEVGKYMDCIFPCYGCRFVALNDGVDTLRENDDITMIFKNVINDIYARETSKKIRAVRRANAESGKFMGYKAPYGYMRSPQDKHLLVIDPVAAETVKKIFDLRAAGNSIQAVADMLNRQKILPPREYARVLRGSEPCAGCCWSRETVRSILGNEVYIGNLVQLKQGRISYKDRRQRMKPPETWARVEGTHMPLIDMEIWKAVRRMEERAYHPRRTKSGGIPLLHGLLRCGICGKDLGRVVNRKRRRGEERTYIYYACRGHVSVAEREMEELLERSLNEELEGVCKQDCAGNVWRDLLRILVSRVEVFPKENGRRVMIHYRFCGSVFL